MSPQRARDVDRVPPNLQILAQALAICLLLHDVPGSLHAPYLPFVPVLDAFRGSSSFELLLHGVGYACLLVLASGRWTRSMALGAGLAISISLVGSRAFYKNDLVFASALLLAIAFSDSRLRLPRAQVCLVYLAAGGNKLLDADWRSGAFFDSLMRVELLMPYVELTGYTAPLGVMREVAQLLPPKVLAQVISWCVFLTEIGLGIGLAVPRTRKAFIVVGLLFHVSLTFVIGETFGIFLYSMTVSYLVFVDWPISVRVWADFRSFRARALVNYASWIRPDRSLWFESGPVGSEVVSGVRVDVDGRIYEGGAGLRRVVLHMRRTYLLLAFALAIPSTMYLVSWSAWGASFAVRNLLIASLLVVFLLLPRATSRLTTTPRSSPVTRVVGAGP